MKININKIGKLLSKSNKNLSQINSLKFSTKNDDLQERKLHQDWSPQVPKHKIKIDDIHYRQPHPVWDLADSEQITINHFAPRSFRDKYALYTIRFLRHTFDKVTFYNKDKMTEEKYLTRAIFLETIAAVPGMVAGMHRHMKALRNLQPDGGWIHHLLEEAENERMHLLTFLQIRQPGVLLRLGIMFSQAFFTAYYSFHYLFSPKVCHRLVGYLEEEAVKTYTNMIKDLDTGKLPRWSKMPVGQDPKRYWELPENATMRDLLLAIRADEVNHREFNHHFANLNNNDPFPDHGKIEVLVRKGKETDEKL